MSRKITLNNVIKIIESKQGNFIIKKYAGLSSRLLLTCKDGHEWETKARKILIGRWCQKCYFLSNRKDNLEIEKIILEKEGKILNISYGKRKLITINCKNDHKFVVRSESIINGHWCKKCNIKITSDVIEKIILNKGGEMLSPFIKVKENIKCKCKFGHIINVLPNSLYYNDIFCTLCNFNKSEEYVRILMSAMFDCDFPSTRLNEIKSTKGRKLELDGFNSKLKIAFEHQGKQHYENIFNDIKSFERLKENDLLKIKRCQELDIKLFVIPGLNYKLEEKNLRQFILDKCKEFNIECPHPYIKINLDNIQKNNNYLEIAQNFAKEKGGECLSENILFSFSLIKWKCSNGHIWESEYSKSIKPNKWCRKCYLFSQKSNINNAIKFGEKYNLICKSVECKDYFDNLDWECNYCNNIFNESMLKISNQIIPCIYCRKRKPIMVKCKNNNLKCLSIDYNNSNDILKWQCNYCNFIFEESIFNMNKQKIVCLHCRANKNIIKM